MSRKWTEEEVKYLLSHHASYDNAFLANVLDRTEGAISKKIKELEKKRVELPEEEEFFLTRSERLKAKRTRTSQAGTMSTAKLSKFQGRGNAYSHTKSGFRPDLKINCRSGWEANVLRVLKAFDIPFQFEPLVFRYPIKRGNKAYTPDIYLVDTEEWIEVKGYLDDNSAIKLKRFKRYYPEEFAKLTMVISKSSRKNREFCAKLEVPTVLFYEEISRVFKDNIKTWEGK